MSLLKYTIFKTIYEEASFTKAAEKLNITQSAASHGIKSLEDELGFKLFVRDKGIVKPTGEGDELLKHVHSLLAANRRLENKINAINNIETGKLTIGSFGSSSASFLPLFLKYFEENHSGIEMEILEGGYFEIVNWIKEDIVDVAFLADELIDDTMYGEPLFEDEIVALIPKSYGYSKQKVFDIRELYKFPYIRTDANPNKYFEHLFRTYNVTPNYQYTVRLNLTIFSFVEQGLGVTLVPDTSLRNTDFEFDALPLKQRVFRKINLVTKKSNHKNPLVKRFFKVAKSLDLH